MKRLSSAMVMRRCLTPRRDAGESECQWGCRRGALAAMPMRMNVTTVYITPLLAGVGFGF